MLIKCPECEKEISDKVTECIHCGYPLKYENPTIESPQTIISKNVSKPKYLILVSIGVMLAIALSFVFYFAIISPPIKYNEAIALLEIGKYEDAKLTFDKIKNYKDVKTIMEQIRYESIAYNCINELKKILKNPDSVIPYEIQFYLGEDEEENTNPSCVIYYGAQNGFGGNTTGYAVFSYSKENDKYNLLGHTNTLKKEDLKEKDDNYTLNFITIILIEAYKNKGIEVGIVDMARIKTVLKNDAYNAIKILD